MFCNDTFSRAGEDFVRNLGIPGLDFYSIHVVRLLYASS